MAIVLDHTILPSKDKRKSAEFYERILGFEDLGEEPDGGLHGVRVSESSVLFFEDSSDGSAWAQGIHHLAFGMGRKEFADVFARLKSSEVPYGNHYSSPSNMRPPKMAAGAKGRRPSIYFKDPSGNLLQILSY
jgi:catechol 2,3-dioxygenase-like lactoylglutathione lyase family enzyme